MTSTEKIGGRLQLQFRYYYRLDPPPSRVKAIPVQVLLRLASVDAAPNDLELQIITYMIKIALYSLLRPGNYTGTKSDRLPFRISDVMFSVGCTVFGTATATDNELAAAVFVTVVFTA